MIATKTYFEHPSKVVEADDRFKHVMAIALDPTTGYKEGLLYAVLPVGREV